MSYLSPRTISLFLNFRHLGFICGDPLVSLADVNYGWFSRRFNNVCKFEIPHFFTLVLSRKCDSC